LRGLANSSFEVAAEFVQEQQCTSTIYRCAFHRTVGRAEEAARRIAFSAECYCRVMYLAHDADVHRLPYPGNSQATLAVRLLLSRVDSPGSHLVDAPIAVSESSGGQPSAVVVGEGFVALVAAFEP
jgi:hypothetical protein